MYAICTAEIVQFNKAISNLPWIWIILSIIYFFIRSRGKQLAVFYTWFKCVRLKTVSQQTYNPNNGLIRCYCWVQIVDVCRSLWRVDGWHITLCFPATAKQCTIDRRCPTLISMQMLISCVDLPPSSVGWVAHCSSWNYSKDDFLCLGFYCWSIKIKRLLISSYYSTTSFCPDLLNKTKNIFLGYVRVFCKWLTRF